VKKQLFGIIVAMAVAGLISLFSARRIEAQFSSPVKIVNTTSAPAITSRMDDPGRVPYQSAFNGISACGGQNYCLNVFPPVPAGHRLVLTQIAGAHLISVPGPIAIRVNFGLSGPSGVVTQFIWDLQRTALGSSPLPLTSTPGSACLSASISTAPTSILALNG
jgi:hypothetical protein